MVNQELTPAKSFGIGRRVKNTKEGKPFSCKSGRIIDEGLSNWIVLFNETFTWYGDENRRDMACNEENLELI